MNNEVIYIAETKEFIVNGQTIKEETLTTAEIIELKSRMKNQDLLTGNKIESKEVVLV